MRPCVLLPLVAALVALATAPSLAAHPLEHPLYEVPGNRLPNRYPLLRPALDTQPDTAADSVTSMVSVLPIIPLSPCTPSTSTPTARTLSPSSRTHHLARVLVRPTILSSHVVSSLADVATTSSDISSAQRGATTTTLQPTETATTRNTVLTAPAAPATQPPDPDTVTAPVQSTIFNSLTDPASTAPSENSTAQLPPSNNSSSSSQGVTAQSQSTAAKADDHHRALTLALGLAAVCLILAILTIMCFTVPAFKRRVARYPKPSDYNNNSSYALGTSALDSLRTDDVHTSNITQEQDPQTFPPTSSFAADRIKGRSGPNDYPTRHGVQPDAISATAEQVTSGQLTGLALHDLQDHAISHHDDPPLQPPRGPPALLYRKHYVPDPETCTFEPAGPLQRENPSGQLPHDISALSTTAE